MVGKSIGWIGDQLQRWQAVYTAWRYIKPLVVPVVTGTVPAWLVALEHAHSWQVFLVFVYGAAGGLLLIYAIALVRGLKPAGVATDGNNDLPAIRGQVMPGYTLNIQTDSYSTTINGNSLADFADRYTVAVVGGLSDPSRDKLEDTRISISQAYTIFHGPIPIEFKYSTVMMAERDDYIAKIKAQFKEAHPEVPKGTPILIPYELAVWHETILLPRGVRTDEIRKLSDVPRHGGKLISHELATGRFRQLV